VSEKETSMKNISAFLVTLFATAALCTSACASNSDTLEGEGPGDDTPGGDDGADGSVPLTIG